MWRVEAGQHAIIHNVKVSNYRSPYAVLYEDKGVQKIGNKKMAVRKLMDPSHGTMPLLRCQFALKQKPIKEATLTATARGIYRATLNGKQVGAEYYAPGISQYNKSSFDALLGSSDSAFCGCDAGAGVGRCTGAFSTGTAVR